MARVQGLIAAAAGDPALAARRFAEALAGWRRYAQPDSREELFASFIDLRRPPIVGLVEPAREIARIEKELAALGRPTNAGAIRCHPSR
jgi:hypothetical protein